MKRRSARPVVVEVKRTGTSTSSLAEAFGRSRSSKGLWQGVPLQAEAPTLARREPKPPALAQTADPDARPAPRILPASCRCTCQVSLSHWKGPRKRSGQLTSGRQSAKPHAPRIMTNGRERSPQTRVDPEAGATILRGRRATRH